MAINHGQQAPLLTHGTIEWPRVLDAGTRTAWRFPELTALQAVKSDGCKVSWVYSYWHLVTRQLCLIRTRRSRSWSVSPF